MIQPPSPIHRGANHPEDDAFVHHLNTNVDGMNPVKILPGGHYVTSNPKDMLITVLGSCVSACIRDPLTGFGGMNHFMLPQTPTPDQNKTSNAMRYGNHAMEVLINKVLASGCPRKRLEIKVFGGAKLRDSGPYLDVGATNSRFILNYLAHEKLPPYAQQLGGTQPRRIHYFPHTGKVRMLLLDQLDTRRVAQDENRFRNSLKDKKVSGDIELF